VMKKKINSQNLTPQPHFAIGMRPFSKVRFVTSLSPFSCEIRLIFPLHPPEAK
jgi:hypothetical protein